MRGKISWTSETAVKHQHESLGTESRHRSFSSFFFFFPQFSCFALKVTHPLTPPSPALSMLFQACLYILKPKDYQNCLFIDRAFYICTSKLEGGKGYAQTKTTSNTSRRLKAPWCEACCSLQWIEMWLKAACDSHLYLAVAFAFTLFEIPCQKSIYVCASQQKNEPLKV